jgi:hypothetical protein
MAARIRSSVAPQGAERKPEPPVVCGGVEDALLLTLMSASGAVLEQGTASNPVAAVDTALRLISRRPFLAAGDTLLVTKPHNGGVVHSPREID